MPFSLDAAHSFWPTKSPCDKVRLFILKIKKKIFFPQRKEKNYSCKCILNIQSVACGVFQLIILLHFFHQMIVLDNSLDSTHLILLMLCGCVESENKSKNLRI